MITAARSDSVRTFRSCESRALVAAGIIRVPDREEALQGRYRFTAAQYHAMAQVGVLSEYEPIDLLDGVMLDGVIAEISPIGNAHRDSTDCVAEMLFTAYRGLARVRVRGSIQLNDRTYLEPDFAILRPRPDYHLAAATPADAHFIIEVSCSSLTCDRGEKLAAYARAGIPEVWIVNLRTYEVEVHTEPSGDRYQTVRTFGSGARITPRAFPETEFPVDGFWSGVVETEPESE